MNLIIIQTRNGSRRLPNKSVLSICGQPTILHVVNRLKSVKKAKIVVATSSSEEDDSICNLCQLHNIDYFRGDRLNVFSRFKEIIKKKNPKYVVRITGDCPLIYSKIIPDMFSIIEENNEIDYISNTLKRTFPQGHDIEIFKSQKFLDKKEPSEYDQEHVTPFFYKSEMYRLYSYENKIDLSGYRITLDLLSDYILLDKIIYKYIRSGNNKSVFDIISPQEIVNIIKDDTEIFHLHEKLEKLKS